MNLTEKPSPLNWPTTHYVYIEKIGPFQETAQKAWESLHQGVSEIAKNNKISGFMSLYRIQPQMIYRAGVSLDAKPASLPPGFQYTQFAGGSYSRFVLTGSYANLPEACGKVFDIVARTKMPLRDDFYIENYVNDPKTTPEDQLITEILIPTK